MHVTAEIRWFCDGPLLPDASGWFGGLPGTMMIANRTDLYLAPTGEDLNVKLREGQVEIKRRGRIGQALPEGLPFSGNVETWHKWSFERQNDPMTRPTDPFWTSLKKVRWKRVYTVQDDGIEPVPPVLTVPLRCEVELTQVKFKSREAWTICFEASGDQIAEVDLRDALVRTVHHVVTHANPPRLYADAAMGYPAWLLRQQA